MFPAVTHQRLCHLLGRADTDVSDQVSMQRLRIIEVDDVAREVSTIVKQQVELASIRARVESRDQLSVLSWRNFNLKHIDAADKDRSDQLLPMAARSRSIWTVGGDAT